MATESRRMVIYLDGLLPIQLHDTLTTWPCKITWQTNSIYNTRVPVGTKLARMSTSPEQLAPIKLLDPLVSWSYKDTWQTILFPILQCLWPRNSADRWLTLRGSYPYAHMTIQLRAFARPKNKNISTTTIPMVTKRGRVEAKNELSHFFFFFLRSLGKLNILYPHLHNQTGQGDDLLWGASTHKFT